MATVSQSLPELSPVQRKGLKLVVVGLLLFASWPVFRLTGIVRLSGLQLGLFIISPYGACVLIWGLYVLRTRQRRPLTPRRALLIPILVFAMFAVVDLLTRGELYQFWEYFHWQWPNLHFGTLARNVPYLGFFASSIYVVLGAAVRMKRRRAVLATSGLVLLFVWLISQYNTIGQTVVGQMLVGIVPFVIGFRASEASEKFRSPARILMEMSAAEWLGWKLTVIGLLLFAAFPVLRLAGTIEWVGLAVWVQLLSVLGACLLVWGLYVLKTKTERPLTPKRAFLIPLLVAAMAVLTDLLTRGWLIEWMIESQPDGAAANLDFLVERFRPFLNVGVSAYAVFGAAIRFEQWRWAAASIGLIVGTSGTLVLVTQDIGGFFALAIPGIVPFLIGYRATSRSEDTTPITTLIREMSAAKRRGVELTSAGLLLFASFPVLRLAGILEWGGGGLWVLLLSSYGACILLWGIAVARTGTKRSLTPQLALWAPILVAVMAVAMDLLTRGRLIEWWVIDFQWSRPAVSNLAYAFGDQLVWIGASTFLVIGAAIGGRRWGWWFVGVGLLAVPVVIVEAPSYSNHLPTVALFGAIPAIIGYRAAAPPEE